MSKIILYSLHLWFLRTCMFWVDSKYKYVTVKLSKKNHFLQLFCQVSCFDLYDLCCLLYSVFTLSVRQTEGSVRPIWIFNMWLLFHWIPVCHFLIFISNLFLFLYIMSYLFLNHMRWSFGLSVPTKHLFENKDLYLFLVFAVNITVPCG